MIDDNNIKIWLNRFFDGETTCEEERELFSYFRQKNILLEVEQYREMMLWYDAGLQVSQKNAIEENNVKNRWFMSQYISIAASIVIVLTVGFSYIKQNLHNKELYEIYEGSYIIENGVRNTDLSEILPILQENERFIENNNNIILDQALEGVEDATEREYILEMILN
ncbi:MAG: hypothetical protein IKV83_09545 [Muribaculaceae bacterium]|nr:hypothetical protein [Muribaculaceae bacterium]